MALLWQGSQEPNDCDEGLAANMLLPTYYNMQSLLGFLFKYGTMWLDALGGSAIFSAHCLGSVKLIKRCVAWLLILRLAGPPVSQTLAGLEEAKANAANQEL